MHLVFTPLQHPAMEKARCAATKCIRTTSSYLGKAPLTTWEGCAALQQIGSPRGGYCSKTKHNSINES